MTFTTIDVIRSLMRYIHVFFIDTRVQTVFYTYTHTCAHTHSAIAVPPFLPPSLARHPTLQPSHPKSDQRLPSELATLFISECRHRSYCAKLSVLVKHDRSQRKRCRPTIVNR